MKKTKKIAPIILLGLLLTTGLQIGTALANTVESSTIIFQGVLVDHGDYYTGTIDTTPRTYYIPMGPGTIWDLVDTRWETPDGRAAVGGFDVYAALGGTAYYDDIVQGTIGMDHDGYSGAGGWGSFWDPDVPDWENYQLTLTETEWYLEYKNDALGTPMSGDMHWDIMCAEETGTGSYRGTVPADPDANDGDAALNGGGAQAWDMDWTWGSEVIPLQYVGFKVTIEPLGNDIYEVTFTPKDCTRKPVGGELDPVDNLTLLKTPLIALATITLLAAALRRL